MFVISSYFIARNLTRSTGINRQVTLGTPTVTGATPGVTSSPNIETKTAKSRESFKHNGD